MDPLAPSVEGGFIHADFQRHYQRISKKEASDHVGILGLDDVPKGQRNKALAKKAMHLITLACHPDKSPGAPKDYCTVIMSKVMVAHEKAKNILPDVAKEELNFKAPPPDQQPTVT